MGASYNTILVPTDLQEKILAVVGDAVLRMGCRVVHREAPAKYEDGFHYSSARTIFVAPRGGPRWLPLSSWGEGLPGACLDWYRTNPLAKSLSESVSPVVYMFCCDGGEVAGYSVFQDGRQVEAQSLAPGCGMTLGEFTPPLPLPAGASTLSGLIGEPEFNYEAFARRFANLERATAALAAHLGVTPHLIDPLDVQDGDGAIIVEAGTYQQADLTNWVCIYYE